VISLQPKLECTFCFFARIEKTMTNIDQPAAPRAEIISPVVTATTPDDDSIELTVLMPCLNEAETLEVCIAKALRCLDELGVKGEVLISDNGSTDGSQELAERCGARVVNAPIRGYGGAIQAGIASARGRYIIMGDADDSYDFSSLGPFVEKLREGHDLVMGNRFKGGIKPGAMPPLHRYLGNPVLSFLGRLFFPSGIGDFHCGLRGFSKDAVERMNLTTSGMEFASEMVVKATLQKLNVAEVPTTLSPDGRSREPHLRSWRDGWRHLRFLLMYSPRWLFFYPGLFLMAAGLILVIMLAFSSVSISGIVLDIHTMLFATVMVTTGFQAAWFAVYTKKFAVAEGLVPGDPMMDRMAKVLTLENGLLAGGLIFLAGLGTALFSIFRWWQAGWGDLEPQQTMRLVIMSCLLLALGAQICFSSFFLSILGLKKQSESS
jgi:glycosyltransferase involved in cell wall biosynthesis